MYNYIDEFIVTLKERYPQIQATEGQPSATDVEGTPYITLAIGGVKHEGDTYFVNCNCEPTDEKLWELWWDTFDKYIEGKSKVVIRKAPSITSWVDLVLDTFDCIYPTIKPKVKSQINGRFTFYK